jgi:hypothetical protein
VASSRPGLSWLVSVYRRPSAVALLDLNTDPIQSRGADGLGHVCWSLQDEPLVIARARLSLASVLATAAG